MGIPRTPKPVKLFIAVMYTADFSPDRVLAILCDRFGATEFTHGPLPFAFTDYYDAEMGPHLIKQYLSFERLIDRTDLPDLKLWTNDLEAGCSVEGRRRVNIDPGYLTNDKLVLATTKDFFHRIYLDKGIYAEVTLHFRKGSYRHFSWTYPDYREPEVQTFLMKARAALVRDWRAEGDGPESI